MNQRTRNQKAFTLVEALVATASLCILGSILFPLVSGTLQRAKTSNAGNLKRIARAAILYGDAYEERIPIMVNGAWRNMRNVRDGDLTQYSEQRTDAWPLLLLPYLKGDRQALVDPRRGDAPGIWSGPALASADPGYIATKNTYRNQNRHPMFGVNYYFLSPMVIPASKMGDTTPTDFMRGEPRPFFQAWEPAQTVFYTVSMVGMESSDGLTSDMVGRLNTAMGDFAANAPGMWYPASSVPYVQFWSGTDCSGDWCGDITPQTPDKLRSTSTTYFEEPSRKNNVAFLDGHVAMLSDVQMAAGTDYLTATPNSAVAGANGGGAHIVDKSKYLWNFDDNYYGR